MLLSDVPCTGCQFTTPRGTPIRQCNTPVSVALNKSLTAQAPSRPESQPSGYDPTDSTVTHNLEVTPCNAVVQSLTDSAVA